jgi:tyrosinase
MTAQSSINGTPHGAVHVAVGGNMGSFPTAGLDPLFWLHHCQVDRLWNLWLAKGGGRSSPIGDTAWRNTVFTFYDECCQQVQMRGCDVLRAAQQLSYVYEVEPTQVNQSCPRVLVVALNPELIANIRLAEPLILQGPQLRRPLVAQQDREVGARLLTHARSQRETVVLNIRGVEADRHPGILWEVYVGLPPQARPTPSSPHFVGNLAMFGDGVRGEGHHPGEFAFPLNRALLTRADAAGLEVTLIPSTGVEVGGRPQPPPQARAPVRIREMSLSLDRAPPAQ